MLGAPAVQTLASLPRHEGNPYVLPGGLPGDHFKGLQKLWTRVRDRARLGDVRLHDLRHSYASIAANRGSTLLIIGALLGHRSTTTTQRYAHLSNDPVRTVADDTADTIARGLAPVDPKPAAR